jgi:hypothetical protein
LYKDSYNKKVFYPQLLKNLQEGGLNDWFIKIKWTTKRCRNGFS